LERHPVDRDDTPERLPEPARPEHRPWRWFVMRAVTDCYLARLSAWPVEKAEEPRDDAAAAESEDEHEQDRRHRGVEPLERELQQPGQRARRQADRSEHRDPDGRTERRRGSPQEDPCEPPDTEGNASR